MIDFWNGEIKDILPRNLLSLEVTAVSYAVGKAMQKFQSFSQSTYLHAKISRVPDEVLDLMALEANTQYYVPDFPRKIKERLVIQTYAWYMHAGTPSVIEEFLRTILGGGYIEEWFNYKGSPYHFKAYARAFEDELIPPGYGTEVKKQIEIYKNTRSVLEVFAFILLTQITEKVCCKNTLRMSSEYYARNNREFLLLDGSWFLDGTYLLNGYRKVEHLDSYSAQLRIQGELVVGESTASPNLRLASVAAFEAKAKADITFRAYVEPRIRVIAQQQIRGDTQVRAAVWTQMEVQSSAAVSGAACSEVCFLSAIPVSVVAARKDAAADTAICDNAWTAAGNGSRLRISQQTDAGPKMLSGLTVEKDLWYLDGSHLLDGIKLLDAQIFKHDI